MVTPCGLAEDPAGQLGLSRALVRASLNGTRGRGSQDWALERDALQALDNAQAEALGAVGAPTAEQLAALLAAQRRAAGLGDRTAWRAELADAPVVDLRQIETPRASILLLTTEAPALPTVARLLIDRRENPAFRGIHEILSEHRARLLAEQADSTARLRREVLGLGFPGDPAGRTLQARPGSFNRDELAALWREIAQPRRSTHVLTGSFDAAEVRDLLQRAFARTGLAASTPPSPPVAEGSGTRNARLTSLDGSHGAAIGLVAADADPAEIAVLLAWLTHPVRQPLVRGLENAGFEDVAVSVQHPFPETARPGLLLIEFVARGQTPPAGQPALAPAAALSATIESLLAEGPPDWLLRSATARVQTRRDATLSHPARLAEDLARACGIQGALPMSVMAPAPALEPAAARALLQRLWNEGPRTVVEQVPDP
jgi:hypothetical protein